MDDIVWIREEAPPGEDGQKPNDALPNSDVVIFNHPQESAPSTAQKEVNGTKGPETNEGPVEIPVVIEFKSTDVPFYKKPEEQQQTAEVAAPASQEAPTKEEESREGDVIVEIYDPTSTTIPASQPVPVEVYDPTSTTVPAYIPVEVEVYDPTSTEVPVIIDHTTPEIIDEATKKQKNQEETRKPEALTVRFASPADDSSSRGRNEVNEKTKEKEEDGFDISECERKLNEATEGTKQLVNQLCDKSQELNQATKNIANEWVLLIDGAKK
ncbi:hypothetical protein NECAME_06685 [Necator americanus]|uniref:Uncharacterized protein n=1 Tax=Necator americanus TaxID=51031 RepID=W2TUR1_NECAM|nr:hypothetical protein NECAME_06685 [Necator americanus]ETN84801.1 hypothetical protein NECAME_06685 [Necator americanus]